jgi:hypothetical protein
MRVLLQWAMCLMLFGCATSPGTAPREYLDERTGATITAVAQPWIFARGEGPRRQDFAHLHALDVNRMGAHRQYLAVLKFWPAPEHDAVRHLAPDLEIALGSETLRLAAAQEDLRALGLADPIDRRMPKGSQTWLYPVDRAALEKISMAESVSIALIAQQIRVDYDVWQDGRTEFREFSSLAARW